jgi:hypothetical protein
MGVQVGVNCPRGKIRWEECRTCRLNPLRPCHLTPDLLQMVEQSPVEKSLESAFSPSRLTGCDRQYALMSGDADDYYTDVRSSWPLVRGSTIHAIFENGGDLQGYDQTLRELRLRTTINIDGEEVEIEQEFDPADNTKAPGQDVFTGKPDVLLRNGNKIKIIDYKTSEIDHELTAAKLNAS